MYVPASLWASLDLNGTHARQHVLNAPNSKVTKQPPPRTSLTRVGPRARIELGRARSCFVLAGRGWGSAAGSCATGWQGRFSLYSWTEKKKAVTSCIHSWMKGVPLVMNLINETSSTYKSLQQVRTCILDDAMKFMFLSKHPQTHSVSIFWS